MRTSVSSVVGAASVATGVVATLVGVVEARLVRVVVVLLTFLFAVFLPLSDDDSLFALSRFFKTTATISNNKQGISIYNIFLPLH